MAWALVSTIVDQLGSLIASEVKDRFGSLFASEVAAIVNVKEEVEKLERKFHEIQAKLNDAEERQVKEEAVKLWLEKLNNVSYEMGDTLDEWNTAKIKADIEKEEEAETSTAKRRKVLSLTNLNSSVSTISQRRDIALKIKEITEKLDEIGREGDMYQFVLTSGNEEVVRPPTDSHIDVSNILGRDKVKADLVSFILGRGNKEERSPHVISLVGMGGVGKTTLAQLAYNDSEVNSGHFEKGWVCVSHPFNKFMVTKAIIKAFGGDDSNTTQWSSLMDKMCETIRGKKLFLVLDDVWTEDSMLWEPFRLALQNAAQGSRILVTTRKSRVADIMGSAESINLEELSDDDCWSIFSTIAFSDRDSEQHKDLEEIGRKISNKCKGLPLAARTLGSLMRFKSRKEQWEMVFFSRLWEFEDVKRGLFAPLLLSYYDLPSPLRRCFTYCAVFPKDYIFDEEDLASMWIAQGYIELNANKERIVARDYFEILVIRSLFQVSKDFENYNGNRIIRYKMHDIVHDLAQFMAKNECITINGYKELGPDLQNARHLYLQIPINAQIPRSIYSAKNLRTLIVVGHTGYNVSKLFHHFRRLRTLSLNCPNDKIKGISDEIEDLMHLRYLKIPDCHRNELPETISNLCNLQILNITIGFENRIEKLPQGISKLINLKHLIFEDYLNFPPIEFPRGIGRLSSLTKLSHFWVGGKDDSQRCELGELKYLNHLQGTLEIYGLGNVVDACEAKNAELKKKTGLRDLCLEFSEENVGNHGGRMETDVSVLNALEPPPGLEELAIRYYEGTTMFPNWMMSLTKLKSLILGGSKNSERLPPLGKFQFLEDLYIGGFFSLKKVGVEFLGIESENRKDSIIKIFPNLKTLRFVNLPEWEEWIGIGGQEEEDCIIIMPCLQNLQIEICLKLKSLPDFLFKTSLQEFKLDDSPILCERYQRGTGEDWAKISHIPNIKIDFIQVQRDGQEVIRRDDEEESDEEDFDEEESDEEDFDEEESDEEGSDEEGPDEEESDQEEQSEDEEEDQ